MQNREDVKRPKKDHLENSHVSTIQGQTKNLAQKTNSLKMLLLVLWSFEDLSLSSSMHIKMHALAINFGNPM